MVTSLSVKWVAQAIGSVPLYQLVPEVLIFVLRDVPPLTPQQGCDALLNLNLVYPGRSLASDHHPKLSWFPVASLCGAAGAYSACTSPFGWDDTCKRPNSRIRRYSVHT